MRVCIPSMSPGGPTAEVADSFQDSDLLDIYDIGDDGRFDLTVQIRNCGGMCRDDAETVIRRGVNAVIVKSIRSDVHFRLSRANIDILRASEGRAAQSLEAMARRELKKIPLRTE